MAVRNFTAIRNVRIYMTFPKRGKSFFVLYKKIFLVMIFVLTCPKVFFFFFLILIFSFEQTTQEAVRHHKANSPISLREQKNQPLGLRGWFFCFLRCISYASLVNIMDFIGNHKQIAA